VGAFLLGFGRLNLNGFLFILPFDDSNRFPTKIFLVVLSWLAADLNG